MALSPEELEEYNRLKLEDSIRKGPMRWDGVIGLTGLFLITTGILFGWFWNIILWFISLFQFQ